MKRYFVLLLSLLFLLCLPSCAVVPHEDEPALTLTYGQAELAVGMLEEQLLATLGDGFTLSEAQSCAGEGIDRLYTYPSIRLYVFAPVGGEARLTSLTYTDDTVSTADGLRVGSSVQAVIAARGKPSEQSSTYLLYRSQGARLVFSLRDGCVTGITLSED